MSQEFFELIKEETGKVLNKVQQQAVLHTEGPLLLLASPGSGKTTTLNVKIAYLILEKKVQPKNILALTFSKASAKDMDERFTSLFQNVIKEPVKFATIHSFAFKIVREYFHKNKLDYQLIEGEIDKDASKGDNPFETMLNKKMVLRRIYKEINGSSLTEEQMDELLKDLGFVKNKMLNDADIKHMKSNVKNFMEVYNAYEAFKSKDSQLQLLDFDDMLTWANDILEKDTAILEKYQQTFKYVLTDESQDTSLVQNKIVEKLASPQNNLCVVADDDQTLYSWRGADPKYLLNFKMVYPQAVILTMEQNYRSSKDIVDTANKFIKRNKNRYEKNMFTENKEKTPISIKEVDSYDLQTEFVVNEIKKSTNLKETAILYRNNSSSINLVNALDYAGLPFYMKDSDNKFFKHWILTDILNFMRFSYNDKNLTILEKIHTKFNGYISKYQIESLKVMGNDKSIFDQLILTGNMESYKKENLLKCKKLFKEINTMKPKKAIQTIRKDLGYEKMLKKISESLGFNYDSLLETLTTLENIGENLNTLEEFAYRLKHLEDVLKNSKFNKHKNALTLSTFHSSKGLEYDAVYMVDLINGVLPSAENIKDFKDGKKDDMEEAVRLFYVGMTRARTNLVLVTYKRKGLEKTKESDFVTDVRKILYPHLASSKGKRKAFKGETVQLKVEVNMAVTHKSFGEGKITHIDEDIVRILFESGLTRQLSIRICSENKLLKII